MLGGLRAACLLALLACPAFGTEAAAQSRLATTSEVEAKAGALLEEYSRKLDAILEEAGVIAVSDPFLVGDEDVVSWLKENRPDVYGENEDFLKAFARDVLGTGESVETPHRLINWYHRFYAKVTGWAERIAGRLAAAWRNG